MTSHSEAHADHLPFEILSEASLAETTPHVLKHGDTFAVYDRHGDVRRGSNGEQGLYHRGTRHLSRMALRMKGRRPVLLNSAVHRDNTLLTVDLTNPDFTDEAGRRIAHGTLHFFRAKLLWEASSYEHLRVHNYGREPVDLAFSFAAAADYTDIFEVRGTEREKRGTRLSTQITENTLTLGYRGLDGVLRKTRLHFSPEPASCSTTEVRYHLHLAPQEHQDFYVVASCLQDEEPPDTAATGPLVATDEALQYGEAKARQQQVAQKLDAASCHITTSNEEFDAWVNRSLDDLNLLLTDTADGYYPYAGIPWYNTFFGRDGLLTALMMLWVNPAVARGVLGYLARTQADAEDPDRVAQPGKILHEARQGEMAATGEVPFQRYYGTVDATPLFVLLAGAYYERTGDRSFIENIWPNIERALHWIDTYGDVDGDGFVEYEAHAGGLTQQGWKDSEDSVFHADGTLAEGPIALCEVQGYVYGAKQQAARLADLVDRPDMAARLREEAARLRERFEVAFWCDDLSMYALALDGEKQPCQVRTSNAGHALFSGIATNAHAEQTAQALFQDDLFCGWGIRTLSERAQRYNPMSYHNGSVWPHDNALIGWGLARYGHKKAVHRLLKAFFDASRFDLLKRLPELFCGFIRRSGAGPTPYPVACAPQAWASAVPFFLLQASLGLSVDAEQQRVVFEEPTLPDFLQVVRLNKLQVGDGTIDLMLEHRGENVGVEILRRDAGIKVVIVK